MVRGRPWGVTDAINVGDYIGDPDKMSAQRISGAVTTDMEFFRVKNLENKRLEWHPRAW